MPRLLKIAAKSVPLNFAELIASVQPAICSSHGMPPLPVHFQSSVVCARAGSHSAAVSAMVVKSIAAAANPCRFFGLITASALRSGDRNYSLLFRRVVAMVSDGNHAVQLNTGRLPSRPLIRPSSSVRTDGVAGEEPGRTRGRAATRASASAARGTSCDTTSSSRAAPPAHGACRSMPLRSLAPRPTAIRRSR